MKKCKLLNRETGGLLMHKVAELVGYIFPVPLP